MIRLDLSSSRLYHRAMPARVGDRLSAARRRWFVGRAAECHLFRAAITAPDLPFYVLALHGPGGVGKSNLLAEFGRIATDVGADTFVIDARNVEPMPDAFTGAMRQAIGLGPADHPLDVLAERPGRQVVLIDTFEMLAPLDAWLRDVFLPQLGENTLVVLAGRHPLGSAWLADPGWQLLLRSLPLRNLSPDESRTFLAQQEIPAARHQSVLEFTHGHPLALSLVAELLAERGDIQFQPEAAPDMIKALLERFVEQVPAPSYRMALEASAIVRSTSESLLNTLLDVADANAAFEWLRGLSFVESGPHGLFPHDLAREALIADLRWRNPQRYALLHDRARAAYLARLDAARPDEQQAVLTEYIFLHHDNPVVRPFLEWQESGSVLVDSLRDSDVPPILEMVSRHEGEESARIAAHWLERQPNGVMVFRDAEQQPAGFMAAVAMEQAAPEEIALDPAAMAVARFLEQQAPLRSDERATLIRFWMARDTYQAVSSVQSLAFISAVRYYLTTPNLACSFFACIDPNFWSPVFAYADLHRVPEADFEAGGQVYGMYWHDWRVRPPMAWLQLLAEREIATGQSVTPPISAPALLVLSEPAFADAVRAALRDFHRPDALRRNPLLRSRLISGMPDTDTSDGKRIALRTVIEETAATLEHSPRDARLFRALNRTYFHPAPTQEKAAELLDLPFSTYRRHLSAGVARLIANLWHRELHGAGN
jgi:hypothetical protein